MTQGFEFLAGHRVGARCAIAKPYPLTKFKTLSLC